MMDTQVEQRRSWSVKGWHVLLLVLAILLAAYVISYFWISRARWGEYRQLKAPGFYYLSPSTLDGPDRLEWKTHRFLARFYAPINAIDTLFGGPHVANEPLWSIGPPR